jgi:hypothetical protein
MIREIHHGRLALSASSKSSAADFRLPIMCGFGVGHDFPLSYIS